MRDTEREAGTQAGEKQAPRREPYVGLDPRTPGSRPGPKADAPPLTPPQVPPKEHISDGVIMDTVLDLEPCGYEMGLPGRARRLPPAKGPQPEVG